MFDFLLAAATDPCGVGEDWLKAIWDPKVLFSGIGVLFLSGMSLVARYIWRHRRARKSSSQHNQSEGAQPQNLQGGHGSQNLQISGDHTTINVGPPSVGTPAPVDEDRAQSAKPDDVKQYDELAESVLLTVARLGPIDFAGIQRNSSRYDRVYVQHSVDQLYNNRLIMMKSSRSLRYEATAKGRKYLVARKLIPLHPYQTAPTVTDEDLAKPDDIRQYDEGEEELLLDIAQAGSRKFDRNKPTFHEYDHV